MRAWKGVLQETDIKRNREVWKHKQTARVEEGRNCFNPDSHAEEIDGK